MNTPGNGSARSPLDSSTHSLEVQTEVLDGTVALTMAGRARAEALDQVKAVLDELSPAPGQRLHLRLAALHSCETPVAWELLEFVRDAKDGGTEVVVESHPDTVVSTILMLADVRDDLGLRANGNGNGHANGNGNGSEPRS